MARYRQIRGARNRIGMPVDDGEGQRQQRGKAPRAPSSAPGTLAPSCGKEIRPVRKR